MKTYMYYMPSMCVLIAKKSLSDRSYTQFATANLQQLTTEKRLQSFVGDATHQTTFIEYQLGDSTSNSFSTGK